MSELAPGWVLTEVESTELHWVGSCRNLVMAFGYPGSQEDVRHVHACARTIERVFAQHGPAKLLFVLPAHAGPPSAEVRGAITRLGRRLAHRMERAAVVIPGTGFGAAVHRGATTGVVALLRPRFPLKVYGDLRAGLAFLVDSESPVPASLLGHCETRLAGPASP